jgi:hypothetical protein
VSRVAASFVTPAFSSSPVAIAASWRTSGSRLCVAVFVTRATILRSLLFARAARRAQASTARPITRPRLPAFTENLFISVSCSSTNAAPGPISMSPAAIGNKAQWLAQPALYRDSLRRNGVPQLRPRDARENCPYEERTLAKSSRIGSPSSSRPVFGSR